MSQILLIHGAWGGAWEFEVTRAGLARLRSGGGQRARDCAWRQICVAGPIWRANTRSPGCASYGAQFLFCRQSCHSDPDRLGAGLEISQSVD